jgi:invasion protein IalB
MSFDSRWFVAFALTLLMNGSLAFAQDATISPKPKVTSFGNWSVLCPPVGDTSGVPCAMQLSMVDKKRKMAVILWRVGFNKKQQLMFDLITPTEVFIDKGVRISFGKAKALVLPYVSCGLRGCESRAAVSKDLIAVMKTSNQAVIGLAPSNGKSLQLKLDVSGLGAALAAIGVK